MTFGLRQSRQETHMTALPTLKRNLKFSKMDAPPSRVGPRHQTLETMVSFLINYLN